MSLQWKPVTDSDAVQDGTAIEVVVEQQIIAIFRDGGALFAIDGM